jgi:hypothetical protein
VNDGHEVISELFGGRGIVVVVTVHFEMDSEFREQPLEMVPGNPTQSVPVGNHNLLEFPGQRSLQKPVECFPFEVDSTCNFLMDFMVRVFFFETLDLSFEIGFLFGGGDSAVDNFGLWGLGELSGSGSLDPLVFLGFFVGIDIVEVLVAVGADCVDVPALGPPTEGLCGDTEFGTGLFCSDIHILWLTTYVFKS